MPPRKAGFSALCLRAIAPKNVAKAENAFRLQPLSALAFVLSLSLYNKLRFGLFQLNPSVG
jgi:hypothetical protein